LRPRVPLERFELSGAGYPQIISELATAARPAAIIAKTARRVAVAQTMSMASAS
jgi:hypothetical protein